MKAGRILRQVGVAGVLAALSGCGSSPGSSSAGEGADALAHAADAAVPSDLADAAAAVSPDAPADLAIVDVEVPPDVAVDAPTLDVTDAPVAVDAPPDAQPDEASPFPPRPAGEPIVAPAHTWTWVEFPGSTCRDGSPAGVAVNWEPASTKVVIFLEGGWACWEQQLCAMNPARVDDNTKHGLVSGDLWNRTNPDNPFADFNQVYVPYCTGDFHAGANPAGAVAGLTGTQRFTGYSNLELFLDRIVATFPQPAQVVLTGASSGGVAVYFNAAHVARRFGGKGLVAIDDCGPPQVDTVFRPCLQSQLRRQWKLDETVLAECGAGCPDHDDYALDLVRHFLRGRGNVGGYVDSVRDGPVVSLYGWPIGDCSGAPPLTADAYQSGLDQLRSSGAGFGGPFSTFYLPGNGHCWYRTDFFTTAVAGTRLVDWTRAVLAGQSLQVGP